MHQLRFRYNSFLKNKMCLLFSICMGLAGHLAMAVPLQSPSDLSPPSAALEGTDMSHYFDSRVVGGTEAPIGFAPHMIALVVGWHYTSFVCGGSLISETVIASAAHCVIYDWMSGNILESFHGIGGTNTWNSGGIVLKFKAYRIHPKYDSINIKYDFAVIKTEEKINCNNRMRPIRLDYNYVGGGVQTFVTGWGSQTLGGPAANQLQVLYPITMSPVQCEKKIKEIADQWMSIPPRDHSIEICTFISKGKGVCHGDSGSALVSFFWGYQIGIVSWGFPCAAGGPDMYGWVGAVKHFFENAIYNK